MLDRLPAGTSKSGVLHVEMQVQYATLRPDRLCKPGREGRHIDLPRAWLKTVVYCPDWQWFSIEKSPENAKLVSRVSAVSWVMHLLNLLRQNRVCSGKIAPATTGSLMEAPDWMYCYYGLDGKYNPNSPGLK